VRRGSYRPSRPRGIPPAPTDRDRAWQAAVAAGEGRAALAQRYGVTKGCIDAAIARAKAYDEEQENARGR
jgi:hypothetical protein